MNTTLWFRKVVTQMRVWAMLLTGLLSILSMPAYADKLPLRIEVLIQPTPTHRVQTQAWAKVFQEMGRSPVFRSGRDGERTRVEESEFRGRKSVTAIGIMNRDGSITFKNTAFVSTSPEPLNAWLERIEQFGPNGPPNENPTWGLSEQQFADVLKLLSDPVDRAIQLKTPMDVVDSLSLPASFRIAFTDTAKKRAFPRVIYTETSTEDFKGLSKGSVLAAALAQFGLGYRPKPGPAGKYILEIDAGTEADNMYPVGWKNTAPIMYLVPALGRMFPVDLQDANLEALINLIANKLELPHFASSFALATERKDLASMKYSRKPDKLPMQRLMDIVGTKNDIALSLRTDEAGSVFLWVTTRADESAFKKRFAHIRPKP